MPENNNTPPIPRWLTPKKAAAHLGIPTSTLHSYVRAGRVPFVRMSERVIRFDRNELDEWLEARHVRVP